MLRIWIIMIFTGIIVYVLFRSRRPKYYESLYTESAVEILKKRYAKVEITKEELERMKNDLRR